MSTKEQRDEWQRLSSLTPGKWRVTQQRHLLDEEDNGVGVMTLGADARFVAAAREAVPALLQDLAEMVTARAADREEYEAAVKQLTERAEKAEADAEAREAWHERLIERLCITLGIEDAEDIDDTVGACVQRRVEELDATRAALGRAHAALRGVVSESDRRTRAFDEAHAVLADAAAPSEPLFYLLDSRSYVGNCALPRAEQDAGYVCEPSKAAVYCEVDDDRAKES